MKPTEYLIVGNGAAGVTAAETIRRLDNRGKITILSAEASPMYSRPGLAYVLMNEIPAQQVIARTREWYKDLRLDLIHCPAQSLDTRRQQVTLADGRLLRYDKLLLATGARATPAPYPGADLEGVVYLDTLAGTKQLIKKARRARRAVVVGGGITAMEMVEGLSNRGVKTHYFLRRNRLWGNVFNEAESNILAERIQHHGIRLHYKTEISEILGNWRQKVRGLRLKDGGEMKCNLLGVGIGVKPQLDLVQGTAVRADRAILVNEYLQSSVPEIFAAGDCAQVFDRWSGQHLLDILWPSAVAEGRAAALNMVEFPTPYKKDIPFNACLLFGLHITIIGQIQPGPETDSIYESSQHLSRGSSEVWFTFPRSYKSAWSQQGAQTLRLTFSGNHLVGALIIGEQSSAESLRYLVEHQVDASSLIPYLKGDKSVLEDQIKQLHKVHGGLKNLVKGEMV